MKYTRNTVPNEIKPGVYLIQSPAHIHVAQTYKGKFAVNSNGQLIFTEK